MFPLRPLHLRPLHLRVRRATAQRKASLQGGEFRKSMADKFAALQAKRVEDTQKQKELTSAAVEAMRTRNLETATEIKTGLADMTQLSQVEDAVASVLPTSWNASSS